jgi:hypothetical protein
MFRDVLKLLHYMSDFYYSFFFSTLTRLRMNTETTRHYAIRLKLLDMGDTASAQALPALAAPPIIFNEKEGSRDANLAFLDTSAG